MLPNSGILVFVSSGFPYPLLLSYIPFHGTSGVTASLCQHPWDTVLSTPWFSGPYPICSYLLLSSNPRSLPSGPFSVPHLCVCCIGEAIVLPFIHAQLLWDTMKLLNLLLQTYFPFTSKIKSAMSLTFHSLALKVLFKVNHLELCRVSWRSNYFWCPWV